MLRWRLLAVVTAGLLLGAGAPKPKDDAKAVQKKMQGTWKVERMDFGGDAPSIADRAKLRFVFEGDKIIIKDGSRDEIAHVRLNPDKKPSQIDITPEEPKTKPMPALGIYHLDGDTLKLCWAKPGTDRPREFTSKKGTNNALIVLKREKK